MSDTKGPSEWWWRRSGTNGLPEGWTLWEDDSASHLRPWRLHIGSVLVASGKGYDDTTYTPWIIPDDPAAIARVKSVIKGHRTDRSAALKAKAYAFLAEGEQMRAVEAALANEAILGEG